MPPPAGQGAGQHPGGQVDHLPQVRRGRDGVRVVDRAGHVIAVDPGLEGPVDEGVADREPGEAVVHQRLGGGRADLAQHRLGLRPPERAHRRRGGAGLGPGQPIGAVQQFAERIGRLRAVAALRGHPRRTVRHRIGQAERLGEQPVHRGQMAEHLGRAASEHPAVPGQFGHLLPLGRAQVAQQRVQLGGLRRVRGGPRGERAVGRAAGQAEVEHLLAQPVRLVQRVVGAQPGGGPAQPFALLGAVRAVGQVPLQLGTLLGQAGLQRPGAEQAAQHLVFLLRPHELNSRHRRGPCRSRTAAAIMTRHHDPESSAEASSCRPRRRRCLVACSLMPRRRAVSW